MIDDINTKRTELANQMAAAGAALLDFTGTAAALAAIPDTEPQQYVAAGTPENIAAILPATICPQRRMRHGERPTEELQWEDPPAATSGDAPADPRRENEIMRKALEDIAQPADAGCGCSFPCRCDSEGAEAINAGYMRGIASDTLAEVARIERAAAPATASGDELPKCCAGTGVVKTIYGEGPCPDCASEARDRARAAPYIEEARRQWEADRAAVSAATKPTADLSIDTPEFHAFMNEYDNEASYGSINKARADLVAYISKQVHAAQSTTKPSAGLSADHDEFWKHVIAYCKGTGNEGQALVDYVNGWVQSLLATKPAGAQEGEGA